MTELLVRTFVRGYEDTQSPEVRTRYGTLASVVGIVCNALLFAMNLSTGVTILSVLIFQMTGADVDAWAGLVVSLFVMAAGVKIAKETLEPLLGEPAGRELYQSVTELMWSFEGVEDVYDLIIHSYGPNRSMASARVAVSREMDIEQAHELIEQIERYVACRLGVLLVIHVDPVEVRDEYILRIRGKVTQIVEQIDPRLELHDFCLSVEDGYTDVSFRLLVPHDYDQKRRDTVEFDILRQINRMEGRYLCVITMDNSYVADEDSEDD